MRLLAHPFIVKNANLGGSKVHLQFSRQANEIQIRFGADSNQDMLSDAIHDLIKSHKVEAENGTEVNLFHWNENDRAWGMRMDRMSPATSRQKAAQVFAEVNKLVADEHGTGPANSRFMSVLRHSLHGLANQTIST